MRIMLSASADVILTLAFLYDEPHIFHLTTMLCTGGNDINSRGVNVGVTEDICKFCDVFLDAIKCASKQVAQIMGKYLIR